MQASIGITEAVPSFTEEEVVNIRTLQHQLRMVRFLNKGLNDQVTQLQNDNRTLRMRLSVCMSLLCDKGIPLPADIEQ